MTPPGYLLDTNVVSELSKRNPAPNVVFWFQDAPEQRLFLSVLVLGEIRQGIERLRKRSPKRAASLDEWSEELLSWFPQRVLPVSGDVADQWGRLNAIRTVPVVDGLLAATALVHNLTLVTRDVGDVVDLGVAVVNPWMTEP